MQEDLYRADREALRSVNFKTPFPQANFTGEGLVPLETVMSRLTRNFDVANLVYNNSWQTVTEEITAKENVLTVSSWIYLFGRCTLVPSSSIFSSKTVTEWIADTLRPGCCCRFVLVHWICVRISACARIPRARSPGFLVRVRQDSSCACARIPRARVPKCTE